MAYCPRVSERRRKQRYLDVWLHRIKDLIERELGTFILYHRTGAPWPLWDRDVIIQTKLLKHPDGMFEVRLQSVDDERMPEQDGIVRNAAIGRQLSAEAGGEPHPDCIRDRCRARRQRTHLAG